MTSEVLFDPAVTASSDVEAPLLSVDDLKVSFPTDDGTVHAVRGVSYEVKRDEVFAIKSLRVAPSVRNPRPVPRTKEP